MVIIMKKLIFVAITLALLFSAVGCSKSEKQKFTKYYFDWFDTATTITGYEYSEEEFNKNVAEIEKIFSKHHILYNIYNKSEEMNNLVTVNSRTDGKHNVVTVDEEIIELIKFSANLYTLTDGKFNIAMGSVLSIWHTYRELGMDDPENAKLPPMDKLLEASMHTDMQDVIIDEENKTVYLADEKMTLDVGAIAKGYACEKAAEHLEAKGVSGYIINAGGNIRSVGSKPNDEKWLIGIENPISYDSENPYIAYLSLNGQSLVTSGSYQRFYTVNGKNYHHIIDPETLMPSERYLSVSVLCNDSGLGDALSTALFNMDYEAGAKLVASLNNVEAMWVLPNGELLYSENFKDFTE